jgi:hypothetical protein
MTNPIPLDGKTLKALIGLGGGTVVALATLWILNQDRQALSEDIVEVRAKQQLIIDHQKDIDSSQKEIMLQHIMMKEELVKGQEQQSDILNGICYGIHTTDTARLLYCKPMK